MLDRTPSATWCTFQCLCSLAVQAVMQFSNEQSLLRDVHHSHPSSSSPAVASPNDPPPIPGEPEPRCVCRTVVVNPGSIMLYRGLSYYETTGTYPHTCAHFLLRPVRERRKGIMQIGQGLNRNSAFISVVLAWIFSNFLCTCTPWRTLHIPASQNILCVNTTDFNLCQQLERISFRR